MSRTPLLPSYDSATQRAPYERGEALAHLGAEFRSRTTLDVLCMIVFPGTAITATVWATRSGTAAPKVPLDTVPTLPYFASLFLVLSFSLWAGYLISVAYDVARVPRLLRQIVVGVSSGGKLALAGVHGLIWVGYRQFFAEWRQPNWVIVFLAVQSWWDVLLFVVYWYLLS
ncbi:uncharacterized protein SETTUDRAFT_161608 [Exserohilum turcica Et28A]|uniref:Uncharacterized protein n=1 Tax=Exserohilum turcicum (strain 28A) TaxID=671987 RepID=R0JY68_EXST2|nr:uncharacterized protein SETTUDRAFT_161608 [Exserohilum turcica Et28A]EOA85863.1 hypothetical protein SETTUDRAFT_161608 [Exserohilum turcica Et28A]